MASLTIRNITVTPLELKLVQRFEGEPVPKEGGMAANITSAITGLFNGTAQSPAATACVVPREGKPRETKEVSGVAIEPFATRATDIRAADPGREVLRLTFEEKGRPGHRYVVDAPGPTSRSVVMRQGGDAEHEFTTVYVPSGGFLAIYSSANLSRWMRELPDKTPLSMLSIPGTHNSPTCHVALPSVRCQAVDVREQLDNGVRFMDIRVSANPGADDDLTLVHSAFPISLTGSKYLSHLLAHVYDFLDKNPSEVLLMSLKREGTGKGTDGDLSRHLSGKRYIGDEGGRRWFTEPRIPTLGEARGRIVLVRRFGLDEGVRKSVHGGRGWGVDGSSWPDNCEDAPTGSGHFRVQDFYEVDQSTNIEKKIELSRRQLERAAEQRLDPAALQQQSKDKPSPPLFVNFLSASNFFNASCWPDRIAAKVNPAVIEYLCMRHGEPEKGPNKLKVGDGATGIVITDWVGNNGDWDLIRCIVGWNARLQLKK